MFFYQDQSLGNISPKCQRKGKGVTYRIRDWDDTFEVAQSRKCKSPLLWVAMPTKQGRGYRRLMRSQNGPGLLGAWCAVIQLAARMPVRGVLADKDGPLDMDDISDLTLIDKATLTQLFELCMSPKINWLEAVKEKPLPAPSQPSGSAVELHNRTGQDITGQDLHTHPPREESHWIVELSNLIAQAHSGKKPLDPILVAAELRAYPESLCRKIVPEVRTDMLAAENGIEIPTAYLRKKLQRATEKKNGNSRGPGQPRQRATGGVT